MWEGKEEYFPFLIWTIAKGLKTLPQFIAHLLLLLVAASL